MSTFFIGPHVSIGGGLANAPANAAKTGATGFGMFVKNQLQWAARPVSRDDAEAFQAAMRKHGYTPAQVLPHAGYLINLATPDPAARRQALGAFVAELRRCHALGLSALNIHPGSHLGKIPLADAVQRVADAVNEALAETEGVRVVVENTAGQGGCLGGALEELAAVRGAVRDTGRLGFCLDTCHAFAAGIALDDPARLLDRAFALLGAGSLAGLHFNDTAGEFGRHLDRHAQLGDGRLGWEVFRAFLQDARCEKIPVVIETPDESRWPGEVARLLEMAG
ncbi:MAG: deoxyribonuclease IV [Kiritimatiellaeota bacterium]|nr:deoxyribonuclease IV [Kiritimatiellota bacterium]